MILELIPMYTLVSVPRTRMFIGHLNSTAFSKVRVAQLVELQTSDIGVVDSSPTMGKRFFFFILHFVAFDALLACRLVTYK